MKMVLHDVITRMLKDYKENKTFNQTDIDELLYLINFEPEQWEKPIKEFEYKNKYESVHEAKQVLIKILKYHL